MVICTWKSTTHVIRMHRVIIQRCAIHAMPYVVQQEKKFKFFDFFFICKPVLKMKLRKKTRQEFCIAIRKRKKEIKNKIEKYKEGKKWTTSELLWNEEKSYKKSSAEWPNWNTSHAKGAYVTFNSNYSFARLDGSIDKTIYFQNIAPFCCCFSN